MSNKPTTTKKKITGFNLLEQGATHAQAIRETLQDKAVSAADSVEGIPIPSLAFQHFLGSRNLPKGRVLEIIGSDGAGKTTLAHTILGWGMAANFPGCLIETENKPMDDERIKQCYSTDRATADLMFNAVSRFQAFEITEVARLVTEWAELIRDPKSDAYVPREYTGVVVIDTFSKLMSPVEALSVSAYGEVHKDSEEADKKGFKKSSKSKVKELDEGSNFLHAKLAHKWTRMWPAMLSYYNLFIVVVNHQNDDTKASMMGGGMVLSPEQKEATNRTTIGGNSWRQIDSFQVVIGKGLTEKSEVRGVPTNVAQNLKLTATKNSYAPKRRLAYKINFSTKDHTEKSTTPVLDFDVELPELLKLAGYQLTIHSKKEASCKELGLSNVSYQALADRLKLDQKLSEDVGQRLRIRGYGSAAEHIKPEQDDEPSKSGE